MFGVVEVTSDGSACKAFLQQLLAVPVDVEAVVDTGNPILPFINRVRYLRYDGRRLKRLQPKMIGNASVIEIRLFALHVELGPETFINDERFHFDQFLTKRAERLPQRKV